MSSSAPEEKPPAPQKTPRGGDLVALTVAICLGIVRDQRVRRSVLFFVMLCVMAMLFSGVVFFDAWLSKRPFLFLLYWGACLWFTLLCILMALYDMLMVRKAAILARRQLAEEMRDDVSDAAKERKRRPPPSS